VKSNLLIFFKELFPFDESLKFDRAWDFSKTVVPLSTPHAKRVIG
jgi:hypothetical protein